MPPMLTVTAHRRVCHDSWMSYQQPIAPPTNALAIAGFVLGVASWAVAAVLSGSPNMPTVFVVWIVTLVPALLAVIFGFVGINTANRLGGRRRTLAIWAVVLGFTPVVGWLLFSFLRSLFFGI